MEVEATQKENEVEERDTHTRLRGWTVLNTRLDSVENYTGPRRKVYWTAQNTRLDCVENQDCVKSLDWTAQKTRLDCVANQTGLCRKLDWTA